MRVTGGLLKGRRIFAPKGLFLRPTTDRVREALFQVISSNFIDNLSGLKVLDLFSGTGALGIEALSRGADLCLFVDSSSFAIKSLKRNLEGLCLLDKGKILKRDVYSLLESVRASKSGFDLILCDPPYQRGHLERLLDFFDKNPNVLSQGGILVIEEQKTIDFPQKHFTALELLKLKRYGDTKLFFIGRKAKT